MSNLGLFFGGRPPAPRPPVARNSVVREARSRISGTVYAIGDLHGRLDRFETLIGLIQADAAQFPLTEGKPTIILLGDLIDRGPESAGCIERAIRLSSEDWCDVEVVKGNHEQALLQFLDDPAVGPTWILHGGAATLLSYGVDIKRADPSKGWASIQAAFAEALPPEHLKFCETMKLWVERDDYIFVHAGVRPGLPIALQAETDLLWIRGEFLNSERPHPDKVVVHGHTPRRDPDLTRWRIGLDTGAYASGVLTAIRLRGPERMLIQAR